jgi:predicted permease
VFSEVGVWRADRPTLNGERNELVGALQVSASFLPMLGVPAHMGRLFTPSEDDGPTDAVLITYEAWQRRFGGAAVLGRRVSLNETACTIVGVLPPGFNFDATSPREFVLPLGNTPVSQRTVGNHFLYAVARLQPGIPLADAAADAEPHVRGAEAPGEKLASLARLADVQQATSRRPLWVLLGASGLLLLIACANVAGLLLGEAEARRHEIAVRAALGGSRGQIVRQLFAETAVLAGLSAVAGLVMAAWLTPLLVSIAPAELPRLASVTVDLRVCAFAALLGVAAALLFGAAPAAALASVDPARSLREGGRDAGLRRRHAYQLIVACEVALAMVLLAAAGLMGQTLLRLTAQPVGFDPGNLVVASIRLPRDPAATPARRAARTDAIVGGLSALPGVIDAAATSSAPFSGGSGGNSIQIEGKTFERDPSANRHIVTERYFATLRIPIVKGRGFEPGDRPGEHVAVVTPEFERAFMDGEAIGRRFTLNGDVHRVVGVAAATKHREYSDETAPGFYALNRQLPSWATQTFVVRTATPAEGAIRTVRDALETIEPTSSLVTIDTMAAMMRRSVAEERFRAQLSLAFGASAMVLAGLGLYALVARGVADRRREIGVRMALGARPGDVLRMVFGQGLRLVGAGLAVGIPAALAASRLAGSLLYGVRPTEPYTFAAVALLLVSTAAAATLLPARRAARIDPVSALRAD